MKLIRTNGIPDSVDSEPIRGNPALGQTRARGRGGEKGKEGVSARYRYLQMGKEGGGIQRPREGEGNMGVRVCDLLLIDPSLGPPRDQTARPITTKRIPSHPTRHGTSEPQFIGRALRRVPCVRSNLGRFCRAPGQEVTHVCDLPPAI